MKKQENIYFVWICTERGRLLQIIGNWFLKIFIPFLSPFQIYINISFVSVSVWIWPVEIIHVHTIVPMQLDEVNFYFAKSDILFALLMSSHGTFNVHICILLSSYFFILHHRHISHFLTSLHHCHLFGGDSHQSSPSFQHVLYGTGEKHLPWRTPALGI